MFKNKANFFLLLVLLLGFACKNNDTNKTKLASFDDEILYWEDIAEDFPSGLSKNDSLVFINSYVNTWLKNKVNLSQAEKNVNIDETKLQKQINDYRSSLIIYTYQKELIYQKLDTLVSDQEVEKYYNEHPNDFTLKDNIVKVAYIKMPKDARNTKQVAQMLKSYNPEDAANLIEFAENFAVNYFIDDDVWLLFEDFLKEVPIQTYNQEQYLKNNTYVEFEDESYKYMVRFTGFRVKNTVSPLSFEFDKIRSLVINKRKIELIRKMEKDVFEEALKSGDIKIYDQNNDK